MNHDDFTNDEYMFPTTHGHHLFVVDWGNKKANTKVIYLHGEPGSSVKDKHKAAFDPEKHHVIFFDQRGGEKSTPTGSLEHNTTQDLIDDISAIAKKAGFQKFYLNGTSWGSTLAFAYALAHPENVEGIVVGGVFTGSRAELDWIDQGHFRNTFPDVWQKYVDQTPEAYRDNPSAYHLDKALNGTAKEQKLSAFIYEQLEGGVSSLDDRQQPGNFEEYEPSKIQIEIYYLVNNCFMPERHILDNAHKLKMPVWMVQGRYDMVCPPVTAYELHRSLPNSKLYWTQSGHALEHEGENIFRAIFAEL